MVQYDPKQWLGLIFKVHRSDTFSRMAWVLLIYAVVSAIIVYIELHIDHMRIFRDTLQIHSLLGFVIGLLLVFRTNSAYDRWWEGRKQWGLMIISARNMAMKIESVLPERLIEERKFFKIMIPNYVIAMKEHLRAGTDLENLNIQSDEQYIYLKRFDHKPNAISQLMFRELQKIYRKNEITGHQLMMIDQELKTFAEIIGACERIKNTPIPFSYNLFLKKFIFFYTITIPFGMAHDFSYYTVPIATFVFYIFGSLELLAEEIEDPFGNDVNDLPTDDLSELLSGDIDEIFYDC